MENFEKLPPPTQVERVIMDLNQDLGYNMQPLSGYEPDKGVYIFQPTINNRDKIGGKIIRPLEKAEIISYCNLLQKALEGADCTTCRVTTKTYPSHHVVIENKDQNQDA